jgi:hypothetical protein
MNGKNKRTALSLPLLLIRRLTLTILDIACTRKNIQNSCHVIVASRNAIIPDIKNMV